MQFIGQHFNYMESFILSTFHRCIVQIINCGEESNNARNNNREILYYKGVLLLRGASC